MKIYSTRHGQTAYNKQEIILGTTNIALDETGVMQAEMLAERIKELGNIDIMIVSPMKRAMTTAKAVADKCEISMIIDDRLREWDYGEYEGKSRFTEGFAENKINFGVRMGKSGESLLQLSHRVYTALDDIISRYRDKNVLIVSHGGVCRVIETYFNDMTTDEFANWFMDNCGLIEYNVN
ncbi:histidine phosphatase family protein [Ruminococcus flavefaciens]|uniref:Probable phosphoglycerate mutase n=1 Tax=Ruminococcus flavefaciens TaxID=1265 RepID=A0A1M7HVK4_RUMFL|nr:histidine phosphatase family protein [Ruminococcus flavefaciens]SHM32510.1 probable phosphoglycerate mutase [Ruminococcus flavefaciens]